MIYLISKQKRLFETDLYKEISFEEAKLSLNKLQIVQVDTETAGLDVFTKPLLCYQLGNKKNQYVFDQSSYSIELFKDFFESERLFIFHNASFDLNAAMNDPLGATTDEDRAILRKKAVAVTSVADNTIIKQKHRGANMR